MKLLTVIKNGKFTGTQYEQDNNDDYSVVNEED